MYCLLSENSQEKGKEEVGYSRKKDVSKDVVDSPVPQGVLEHKLHSEYSLLQWGKDLTYYSPPPTSQPLVEAANSLLCLCVWVGGGLWVILPQEGGSYG